MGIGVATVEFTAKTQREAVAHPTIRKLPAAGLPGTARGAANPSRVVGVKLIGR
jgi:hypothetical protein